MVGCFLLGLRGFGVPPWSGELFPGWSLFCAVGLYLFGSLPSFLSCSSGVLRPGDCSFSWVGSSITCVLAYSSGDGFPGVRCSVVCFQSRSPLLCRGSVLFLRLRFVRRLSPSVVFFRAFAMRSPLSGSSVGWVLPLDRNEGLVCWSCLYSFGMGSPFGAKCVLHTLLITIEGLPFAVGSCSFTLGSHARCFCLRLVFSWLDVIVCLCAPLLFSVWLLLLCGLPSLGIFSLLRIIGPLATVSSSCFPSLFLLAESSVSLFLLCSSLRCRVVFRSLCGLLCSLWTYSLMGSSPGGPFFSFFYCLGFQLLVFGGSRWSPSCFLFEPRCFPFFL